MIDLERQKRINLKLAERRAEECKHVIHDHAGCYCKLKPINEKTHEPVDPEIYEGRYWYYRTECFGRPSGWCPCPERYEPQGTVEDELVKIEEAGK